jgi:predicted N-acetyltransferase YhbS
MTLGASPLPVVRLATAADDAPVGALLVRAFVERYAQKLPDVVVTQGRKEHLQDVSAKRAAARVWVAELDAQVVGTVALFPPGAPGSEAWLPGAADLRHLAVEPRLHGRGLSRLLLDAAEAEARSLGATAICLHVRREATGIRRLYEARGYRLQPAGDLDRRPEVYLSALALDLPR